MWGKYDPEGVAAGQTQDGGWPDSGTGASHHLRWRGLLRGQSHHRIHSCHHSLRIGGPHCSNRGSKCTQHIITPPLMIS